MINNRNIFPPNRARRADGRSEAILESLKRPRFSGLVRHTILYLLCIYKSISL